MLSSSAGGRERLTFGGVDPRPTTGAVQFGEPALCACLFAAAAAEKGERVGARYRERQRALYVLCRRTGIYESERHAGFVCSRERRVLDAGILRRYYGMEVWADLLDGN